MAACSARVSCEVATFSSGNASLGKSVCRVSPTCKDLSVHEEGFKLFIKGQTCSACVGDARGYFDVAFASINSSSLYACTGLHVLLLSVKQQFVRWPIFRIVFTT